MEHFTYQAEVQSLSSFELYCGGIDLGIGPRDSSAAVSEVESRASAYFVFAGFSFTVKVIFTVWRFCGAR